jgi:extradiol dioxygenase family protein
VDFDLYGHQLVAHLDPALKRRNLHTNPVDGEDVPVPHFGIVLSWKAWHALADRLKREKIRFIIAPTIRFKGKVGEQATMFFSDPAGNVLEFKSFQDPSQLFAKA